MLPTCPWHLNSLIWRHFPTSGVWSDRKWSVNLKIWLCSQLTLPNLTSSHQQLCSSTWSLPHRKAQVFCLCLIFFICASDMKTQIFRFVSPGANRGIHIYWQECTHLQMNWPIMIVWHVPVFVIILFIQLCVSHYSEAHANIASQWVFWE